VVYILFSYNLTETQLKVNLADKKIRILDLNLKFNTCANTVCMFNKLVMLFALTFRQLQSFSSVDYTRIAPVNRIKSIARGLVYRPQFALYRDAVVFNFLCTRMAKSTPYPPCTGTVIWLACRRVPGLLPDAASGNDY